MSESNKKFVCILFSVAIIAASILFVVKPNFEAKSQLEAETQSLETKYAELQEKNKHRAEYEQGIKDEAVKFDKIIAKFPAGSPQDKLIMFLQGIEDRMSVTVAEASLEETTLFYNIGSGPVAENVATQNDDADDGTLGKNGTLRVADAQQMSAYRTKLTMKYVGKYAGLKNLFAYVLKNKERIVISGFSLKQNEETKLLSGELMFNFYAVAGQGRQLDETAINNVKLGTPNIFNSKDKSDNSITGDYSLDDGKEFVTDYDHFIFMNPATSDQTPLVIGAKEDDNSSTYLSSDKNEVQSITIRYFMNNGKYYVAYKIGEKSFPSNFGAGQEFDPGEKLSLLVNAANRKNADDKVAVNATIFNETDKPLNIKVQNDDKESPRFKIIDRKGKVVEYK